MTKQELATAILSALVASSKDQPSPEAVKKLMDTALAWADAIEKFKDGDRKYQMFFI